MLLLLNLLINMRCYQIKLSKVQKGNEGIEGEVLA